MAPDDRVEPDAGTRTGATDRTNPRDEVPHSGPTHRTTDATKNVRPFWSGLTSRLTPLDREVLWWWLLTRLAILVVAFVALPLFSADGGVPGPLERWEHWDFEHFDRIATDGYFDRPAGVPPLEAFFPGLPLVLRLGAFLGLPTILTGLLTSFVAGAIATVALARLAEREYGPGIGQRAALAWMISPLGVFLAAPYTEALFLAFAVSAWLAARRGHWVAAGILAAGAAMVRVSGIFLIVALLVEFALSHRRRLRDLPWLALPGVPVLVYMAYLRTNTGDWLAWYHAQAEGWSRDFTWPWESLANTWIAATGGREFGMGGVWQQNYQWMFAAELVAMGVGVALTALLLLYRRWGEAVWIGIQLAAFSTSYWFFSVPRSTLLWFPLWCALGALAIRRPWVWRCYLVLAVPLFVLWIAAFLLGKWSG